MKWKSYLLFFGISGFLHATDYTFVDLNSPWNFGKGPDAESKSRPWHIEADYTTIGKAKVRTRGKAKGTHIRNSSSTLSLYRSQFLDETNSLSWQLGYNFMRFDWKGNPRFDQKDFHYGTLSLAWISHGMEDWRWVLLGGVTANIEYLGNFGKSAVGYAMVWGRYAYELTFGIHIGFFGYAGVQNGLLLPILGFDWTINEKWRIKAVAPLVSLDYTLAKGWFASLSYNTFGGPYRFPWRYKGGVEKFKNGIFKFYSSGVDLSLNYSYETILNACIGGGYNIGGWALIKDKRDRHAKYYKYNSAFYGLAELDFTF